ncbi:hypothetical protein Y032_0256g361 [Ancylostoma ceylanicum]|uniref:SCP domain-containing protein n=1 Tax=Ancylostoma ceylanicum TaxID=53326 RepID=A0A016SC17_9BILA|nr:hypothetical protein Y032_0256g361 [Ancylostoma ceylanicum]
MCSSPISRRQCFPIEIKGRWPGAVLHHPQCICALWGWLSSFSSSPVLQFQQPPQVLSPSTMFLLAFFQFARVEILSFSYEAKEMYISLCVRIGFLAFGCNDNLITDEWREMVLNFHNDKRRKVAEGKQTSKNNAIMPPGSDIHELVRI